MRRGGTQLLIVALLVAPLAGCVQQAPEHGPGDATPPNPPGTERVAPEDADLVRSQGKQLSLAARCGAGADTVEWRHTRPLHPPGTWHASALAQDDTGQLDLELTEPGTHEIHARCVADGTPDPSPVTWIVHVGEPSASTAPGDDGGAEDGSTNTSETRETDSTERDNGTQTGDTEDTNSSDTTDGSTNETTTDDGGTSSETDGTSNETSSEDTSSTDAATCEPTASERPIRIGRIHEDPAGPDAEALEDEWIEIINTEDSAVDLTGWHVHDADGNRYDFPDGAAIPAQDAVTLRTGAGEDTETDLYWGSTEPIWDNDEDTVCLVDDTGEDRDRFSYP